MRRSRRALLVAFLLLVAAGVAWFLSGSSKSSKVAVQKPSGLAGPFTVASVVDGDTIRVVIDGKEERVRLLQIDAAEMDTANGKGSKRALERLLAHGRGVPVYRKVHLEFDGRRRDRHGRLLAYVWCGETNLSVEMVRRGEAEPFFRYGSGPYDRALRTGAR